MSQTEILSLAERLIPVYHSNEFEALLSKLTEGDSPSIKLLVRMELNRLMAPCNRNIDLRGRVRGKCLEYHLNGLTHWLDDIAFNDYHKYVKRYGGYTEGVREALYNTRNNFRVMQQTGSIDKEELTDESSPFEVEAIFLGYDLKRKENRLKIATQVRLKLPYKDSVIATTVDLSPSGARFKVPSSSRYKAGDTIRVQFTELYENGTITGLEDDLEYQIIGIEESCESDSVRFLRTLRISETEVINDIINDNLKTDFKRTRYENQDKIVRARTRAYEHIYLKHAFQLPVFFSENELKVILLTEANQSLWQYWHDERNLETLSGMLNKQRMSVFTKPGVKETSNVFYTFQHHYNNRTLFYSMMQGECVPLEKKLFWHVGAKKDTWRVFRVSIFELTEQQKASISLEYDALNEYLSTLTHYGFVQEISNDDTASDYLLTEKPQIPSSKINRFRQTRKNSTAPLTIYFDSKTQRKEPRYQLQTPIEIKTESGKISSGTTIDISKRGISVLLNQPIDAMTQDKVLANYLEIREFDKRIPLHSVPYQIVRISPNSKRIQLLMEDNSATLKFVTFFNRLIESNIDHLPENGEILPSYHLLESLHNILLDHITSPPVFVIKQGATLKTQAIGMPYPLPPHVIMFSRLGHNQRLSLEPIYKGHTRTLLSMPMKHIEGAPAQCTDVYISIKKFKNRIQSIDKKLLSDFADVKERINFIKDSLLMGDFFVIRVVGLPILQPSTTLLKKELEELMEISQYHAASINKEMLKLAGYGELVDITDEILTRLELSM